MSGVASDGNSPHPAYRPDIDGLRAIAVLSVVAYHAFPVYVPGGLVGVDIFFVISGFLISSIIMKGLTQERFSYLEFYSRRIRRIFPAMVLVLTVCLVFGWFTLYDREYASLGKHVAAAVGFILNFQLLGESGYFDTAADYKPLLHLWSLGVEEQFYLVWPLLLALLWKKSHTLLPLILTVLFVSLLLNAVLIYSNPEATFYLPWTRFWELMIGALLAYWKQLPEHRQPGRNAAETAACLGLALIVAALLVIDSHSRFPGLLALLPTLGAMLLILAGPDTLVNRRVLSMRVLVFVGLISYPLYLWHWPLLSFARIINTENPGRALRGALVIAACALAWLTYELLEKPVRGRRGAAAVLFLLACILGAAGIAINVQQGLGFRAINRSNDAALKLLARAEVLDHHLREERYKAQRCDDLQFEPYVAEHCLSFGRKEDPVMVVWGDSHTWAWSPVFYRIAEEHHMRAIVFAVGACPPLPATRRADSDADKTDCANYGVAEKFLASIRGLDPKQIFIVPYWALYTPPHRIEVQGKPVATDAQSAQELLEGQLHATLAALPMGVPVTLFRGGPVLVGDLRRGLMRKVRIEATRAEHDEHESTANDALDAVAAMHPEVSIFDPTPRLCKPDCKAVIDDTLMYYDAAHISAQGSMLYLDDIVSAHPVLQR